MSLNGFLENSNGIMNPIPSGIVTLPGPFSTVYNLTDIAYDYAIGGIPFLSGESLRGTYFRRMYTREFSPIRKDQFDNQQVPGEQSIWGWWLRSQSSFVEGAGVQFLDTTEDATLGVRFQYSEGLDVMGTPGQTSLLQATKAVKTGLTGPTQLRGVQKSGTDGVLVLDTGAKTLSFVDYTGTSTSYSMPGGLTGMANTFTDDGTNYYFADKTGIYKGAIATPGTPATKVWNTSGTTAVVVAWVKGRLVGCIDNNVYELVGGSPPTLPIPKFTHQNSSYTFSAISEIPSAILTSGSAGGVLSQIHKFTLNTDGTLPVLTSGVVTTTMPIGETILTMYAYIGTFVAIGTNKGFRVATTDTNANLIYGPLIVQDPSSTGVLAVAGYDRFLFIGNQANRLIPQQGWTNPSDASVVDMLVRVDLSQTTTNGAQPYANDLMTTGTDGTITSIANVGASTTTAGMLAFATGTKVWMTDTANKQANGFLYTSKIRFNTLEPKHFKYIFLRNQRITDGGIDIYVQNPQSSLTELVMNVQGFQDTTNPTFIPDVGNAQEWVQFKFILHRGTASTNYTPVWNGYNLRGLPGVTRQVLITVPLICHDHEKDKFGNVTGYDGFAFSRIQSLETLIASGNIVLYQDLNYNVSNLVIVDSYRFEQQAVENPKGSSSGNQDSNARNGYLILQCRVIQ